VLPGVVLLARANRAFLVRAVQHVAQQGVHQFLDLGTAIPTSPNVHEAARVIVPGARVAYVENDPVVTVHSQALRATTPGVIAIDGDIRRPRDILTDPVLGGVIDFAEPVAVLLVAVLHFIHPEEDPAGIVAAFRERMAPEAMWSYRAESATASTPRPLSGLPVLTARPALRRSRGRSPKCGLCSTGSS
jgi:hypothetical protein